MNNKHKNRSGKTNILSLKKVNQDTNENNVSTSTRMPPKLCRIDDNPAQSSTGVSRSEDITLSFDINSYFLTPFQQQKVVTSPQNELENLTCSAFQLTNPEWDKENFEEVSSSQFYESSQVLKQLETVISSCEDMSDTPIPHKDFKAPLPVKNTQVSPQLEVKQVLKKMKENDEDDVLNETISHQISQVFKSSQYKREVSGLFNHLETTLCQITEGQDINLQKDSSLNNENILSSSVANHDWENDSIFGNCNRTKISDRIKNTVLNNLENPQPMDISSDIPPAESYFVEMGPFYGLPTKVLDLIQQYKGIDKLYDWQDECLQLDAVKKRKNLVYALPTSGGKTLVSEILIFREILCRRKNVIFVLPYVSIVQEKVWALSPFALALNFLVEEYAAGKGTFPPRRRRLKRSVYVATIEKALGLINALLETNRLSELGLVVVDELHLLGEPSRGSTLEQLLTKLKSAEEDVHIVGMSATIGNLPELCTFLNAESYTKDFRPVELKEYVKCGNQIAEVDRRASTDEESLVPVRNVEYDYSEEVAKIDPDRLAGLVMEVIPNESCLVFCASKKNCENVSLLLCRVMPRKKLLRYHGAAKAALLGALRSEGGVCPTLKRTILFGVAYHHSGLTADERRLIEDAFRVGTLCVICCTSTLAAGVNLPAKRVILRSPYIGRDFLTLARYKQMSGRAGRAGLSMSLGESILLCEPRDLPRVTSMLRAPMERVQSRLADNAFHGLRNLVLSCIALGTAPTRRRLHQVTQQTLLAVQQDKGTVKQDTDGVISDLFKLGALNVEGGDAERNVDVLLQESMISLNSPKPPESKKQITITSNSRLIISKLGMAAIKGGLDLDTAHILYDDLVQAQGSLVLLNCLHLLYLVTPYDLARQMQPSKQTYYTIYLELGPKELQTARILGLDEACLSSMMTGRRLQTPERITNRFYLTLILYDLWEGHPVFSVADKFQVSRGLVQQLMVASSTFSANVVRFCEQLPELWSFASLLRDLGQRLQHCAAADLQSLLELPAVKQGRARQLLRAGYKSLQMVARADPREMVEKIEFMSRRVANQLIAAAKIGVALLIAVASADHHVKATEHHVKAAGGAAKTEVADAKAGHVKKTGKKYSHSHEKASKGRSEAVVHKKQNEEHGGKKHHAIDEAHHATQNHQAGRGAHGAAHKAADHHKKTGFVQGFREQYHKDEHKKSDNWFSNKHKSGEWVKFGAGKSKHHAFKHDKDEHGKYQAAKHSDKHGKEQKHGGGHDRAEHKGHQSQHGAQQHFSKHEEFAKKKAHAKH